MYRIIVLFLAIAGCATVEPEPQRDLGGKSGYEELAYCPGYGEMTNAMMASGSIRCRALCSSYGRDFKEYHRNCMCECAPDPKAPKPPNNNQM